MFLRQRGGGHIDFGAVCIRVSATFLTCVKDISLIFYFGLPVVPASTLVRLDTAHWIRISDEFILGQKILSYPCYLVRVVHWLYWNTCTWSSSDVNVMFK